MLALAEDHRNDIISNLGAIAFGAIASISQKVWWFDPVGAILISLYIIWSWMCILKGQVSIPNLGPMFQLFLHSYQILHETCSP